MIISFLKNLDYFKMPIETYFTSHDRKNKKTEYKDAHDSAFGGILTLVCFLVTAIYLVDQFIIMLAGENDNYNRFGDHSIRKVLIVCEKL